VVPGDAVYVLSEDGAIALHGPIVESLAPLLDGSRTPATLRDAVPDSDPEQIVGVLAGLADAGLITLRAAPPPERASDLGRSAIAYWDACGIDAAEASAGVAQGHVQLITVGVDRGPAEQALRECGLNLATDADTNAGQAELSVVLCEDYLADGLAGIDAAHRETGRPWLLAKLTGAQLWVGPVFTPGDGACWQCLAARLWGNRPAEAHVRDAFGLSGALARPEASIPPLRTMGLGLVALQATQWLAGHRYPGQRSLWIFDSREVSGRPHEVVARPQCPACGNPELISEQGRQPVIYRSRPKRHLGSGGHRALTPEQVLARYRHLVSPVTGVIREIRRDPRGPTFLNSFSSGPNAALGMRGARRIRSVLRQENGGKGVTPEEAEVGALCEALERYSARLQGDELRVRGSIRTLGDAAIHPDRCQLFHSRQFTDRARWNSAHSASQRVCDPFDDGAMLDWTPVWSLTRQQHRLLPTGMLYFGTPTGGGPVYVLADSNGNAAGSSVEDAILQGMLEVVERDAVAIWWYNRLPRPGVDLDAFGDTWLAQLRDVYAGLRREVWVLDVTADLGVPTMVAVSRRTGTPREDIMFGFGAHFDPATALRRALTELNQLLPAVLDLDNMSGQDDPDAMRWWQQATVADQPYLVPDPTLPARTPADYSYVHMPDLADDIETLQTRLENAGLEVLVLDQTRPDVGLPVVKVIVPGMRGFWARLAPGRLYDVPLELGQLTTPTEYHELNPLPLFC